MNAATNRARIQQASSNTAASLSDYLDTHLSEGYSHPYRPTSPHGEDNASPAMGIFRVLLDAQADNTLDEALTDVRDMLTEVNVSVATTCWQLVMLPAIRACVPTTTYALDNVTSGRSLYTVLASLARDCATLRQLDDRLVDMVTRTSANGSVPGELRFLRVIGGIRKLSQFLSMFDIADMAGGHTASAWLTRVYTLRFRRQEAREWHRLSNAHKKYVAPSAPRMSSHALRANKRRAAKARH